jgi:Zn-dependent protease
LLGWRREEIGEPASWILAILAMVVAVGKVWRLLDPYFYMGPYFTGILLGFLVHEASHRYVARRYGFYSEFRATFTGLLITAITGFIPGLIVLAPGYVAVYVVRAPGRGWIRSVEAGPLSNIILAIILLAASVVVGGWPGSYMRIMASINAWIAFFNLLPVPPLDGAKIARADLPVWGVLIATSIILLFYP